MFVLRAFQKRRHPKNVDRSLGISERFVMFVQLFCCCLDTELKEFRSCSVDTVPFLSLIKS